jgi:adenylylsulfate kinase
MVDFHFKESWKRSFVKTLTYRILIVILDFSLIYLLTGGVEVALGFVIVSNTYTSVAYFVHERFWDRVKWGKQKKLAK